MNKNMFQGYVFENVVFKLSVNWFELQYVNGINSNVLNGNLGLDIFRLSGNVTKRLLG